ncbi:hypothetical protein [Candidatus Igneacidithiobacillus taiwanensis]|uniref:hypothetical protein n=1 Tax=Candidatus Igneacidithiobacillus taiwanensis TaxID=1945924 RepID=UPI0028971306|nr:hypothetical protein [Candidatus Igneacidithiobacillus taiwanensis]
MLPASGPDTAIPGTILVPRAGLPALTSAPGFAADGPLWQRVPSRDEYGQLLADFRMLFPGLRRRNQTQQLQTLQAIGGVLQRYQRWVVFADLNLRMNLLWVSVRPRPGLTVEIPAAILEQVPEARLLAAYWRR